MFAAFTTNDGVSYEGKGIIRAHEHPDSRLAIDLVFTRHDSAYKRTDILFHLSPRQLRRLQKSERDENYDFQYEGQLMPDSDPDESGEKE